jgi:acyl-CoA synthetase (AMP-forming)/AMP-acid ligase II
MEWGRTIGEKLVNGYRVKIYEPRPPTMLAFLREATKFGGREFLIFDDRRISYAAFIAATARARARLEVLGVRKGDVVPLSSANGPEYLLLFWAILRAGGIVAQANSWWSAGETADAMQRLGARLLLADGPRRDRFAGEVGFENIKIVAVEDFVTCFAEAGEPGSLEDVADDEEDPAVLIFTSGTTGTPKAAVLSHRAVVSVTHNTFLWRGRTPEEIDPAEPQQRVLRSTPLFHVGGMLAHTQGMLGGHCIVLMAGKADGRRMLQIMERERVTNFPTVPTLLARVIDHPDLGLFDTSSVTSVGAGGAMVSPELMRRARAAFPNAVGGASASYGMTETGGFITMIGGEEYRRHPDSSGRAFPTCELSIRDPDDKGEGEILIRAPSAMSGYWGQEAETIIDAEGWIHSGDLGRLGDDGHLHVTGRLKDIIIRGGENISPAVIEARLCAHDAVLEAAAIGLPHAELGEEVGAVVVTRAGSTLSVDDATAWLRGQVADFAVPTRWWIRERPLPVTASNKVLKSALKEEWAAGMPV